MLKRIAAVLLLLMIIAVHPVLAEDTAATRLAQVIEDPSLLTASDLNCEAAVLIDADSGNVLFSKNDKIRMYPASTTKVLTLLLGIEFAEKNGYGLDYEVTIPQAAADVPTDSTLIPVYPGEKMSFRDLLIGFTVNSGNDGANAIAVIVSGTTDAFVDLMNQRAAEIGCTGTHFANAHGYSDDDHYTTAYDMALIAQTAMRNSSFREIVNTRSATLNISGRGEVKVKTGNKLMDSSSSYYDANCIGIKTGTTHAAGKCYVGAAEKDGATLISVVFNCSSDENRWKDTELLFRFGWTCYDTYTFSQMFEFASPQIASFAVSNAASDDPRGGALTLNIAQISNNNYIRMIERGNDTALTEASQDFISRSRVEITHTLTAPISVGEIIGAYYYTAADGSVINATLVASRDVAQKPDVKTIYDYLPWLRVLQQPLVWALVIAVLVLLLLILILIARKRAEKQRRRRRVYEQRRREYERRRTTAARGASNVRKASPAKRRR